MHGMSGTPGRDVNMMDVPPGRMRRGAAPAEDTIGSGRGTHP